MLIVYRADGGSGVDDDDGVNDAEVDADGVWEGDAVCDGVCDGDAVCDGVWDDDPVRVAVCDSLLRGTSTRMRFVDLTLPSL